MMPELVFSEEEPRGPIPAGNRSEYQVGDAFSRWFAAPFEGVGRKQYAHIEIACYQRRPWTLGSGSGPVLMCETTYTICTASDAPGDTEEWSDTVYDEIEPADPDDPDQAEKAVAAVRLEDVTWPASLNQAVQNYAR